MQITRELSRHQLVPFSFTQVDLVASQTNVQLLAIEAMGGPAGDGFVVPFDGEVVAVTADLVGTAATAGTLTVGASIDGTEDADTTLTLTTAKTGRKIVKRSSAQFAAGARIGCEITTDGSWNGTDLDIVATVWVVLAVQGI